ncbi:MAG TPA: Imm1 family immunity protein [Pseudonocardiaceae bacterium]
MIIVGEHPYDPAATGATPMLLVAVGVNHGAAVGAAYYRQLDRAAISGWITANPQPIPDAPEFAFSSQGRNSFPATAVVDVQQLRALVTEYMETGRRPECVPWQASEMVQ